MCWNAHCIETSCENTYSLSVEYVAYDCSHCATLLGSVCKKIGLIIYLC